MDKVYQAMKRAQKISKNKKPKSKKKGDGKGKNKSSTSKKLPGGFTQFVMDKAHSEVGGGRINPLDPRMW